MIKFSCSILQDTNEESKVVTRAANMKGQRNFFRMYYIHLLLPHLKSSEMLYLIGIMAIEFQSLQNAMKTWRYSHFVFGNVVLAMIM